MNRSPFEGLSRSALAVVACALSGAPCVAGIVVHSTERSVSVAIEVSAAKFFTEIDSMSTLAPGHWSASVGSTYSTEIWASAAQSTQICATGISGWQSVTALAAIGPTVAGAVSGGQSQIEVVFGVQRLSTFIFNAAYDFTADAGVAAPIQPFISIAGIDLFLPEPEGSGSFALTLVLEPGVYTFSAMTVAVANVPSDGFEFGASAIGLSYSFTLIPAPTAALLLLAPALPGSRRRRCGR